MDKKKSGKQFSSIVNRYLHRRDFLKFQLKGLLFLAAGASVFWTHKKAIGSQVIDIAVVKGPTAGAVRAAVELMGGMKNFVKPGNRVLIKPNMSFPNPPEWATTTNPGVIRELALMCREAGASKVLVTDYTLFRPGPCLERSGILDACSNLEWVSVAATNSERLFQETRFPGAEIMSQNGVLKEALNADVLIAAPVAKSHTSTGVSLSMKGMMGLVWDRGEMHSRGLSASIVDMCRVLKADLTVIDGTRVLSTRGPRGPGEVLKEDTIIASRDMVAADAYAVSAFTWYGRSYKPRQVAHILKAHERGLGRMDVEKLHIKKVLL